MAEGDGAIYNKFKEQVLLGEVDLVDDTLKVALVAAYTPDIDTHTAWATTAAPGSLEFATDGNYSAATLGSASATVDTDNDRAAFDGADVTWSSLNLGSSSASPSHAVMYDDTHASDLLVCYWEVTTASNGGNYTLQFNATGIMTLT